ncbi:hypothetical protein EDC01DRAFT_776457 [Geopyxis carbonaria]|nr:hypothetical protein EDC01DRAFT_776457 [Geopyxis carbonaria]
MSVPGWHPIPHSVCEWEVPTYCTRSESAARLQPRSPDEAGASGTRRHTRDGYPRYWHEDFMGPLKLHWSSVSSILALGYQLVAHIFSLSLCVTRFEATAQA